MRYARPRPQQRHNGRHAAARPRYNPGVRAGLVIGPAMDYAGLGDAERIFVEEGVALAPMSCGGDPDGRPLDAGAVTLLPTATVGDIEKGALVGVVAPGGPSAGGPGAAAAFDKLVNTACEEQVPVMAFGDAVPRALTSLGYKLKGEKTPPGVLLHDGVRILESEADVRDAVAAFRKAA